MSDEIILTQPEEMPPHLEEEPKMKLDWYVVQVMSGMEKRAKENLEKRIRMDGMADYFNEILIPTEHVSEVKSGKKKITVRKFFPGYILVRMNLTDETWYLVRDTEAVIGFAQEGKPAPLQDHEIEAILSQMEGKKEKVKPKVHFEKGENIKVIDGPFVNINGVIDEVNPDRGKLKVMVLIFGRATPVELEYWQVERI